MLTNISFIDFSLSAFFIALHICLILMVNLAFLPLPATRASRICIGYLGKDNRTHLSHQFLAPLGSTKIVEWISTKPLSSRIQSTVQKFSIREKKLDRKGFTRSIKGSCSFKNVHRGWIKKVMFNFISWCLGSVSVLPFVSRPHVRIRDTFTWKRIKKMMMLLSLT